MKYRLGILSLLVLFLIQPNIVLAVTFWESTFNARDCDWRSGAENACLEIGVNPVQIDLSIRHEGAGSVKYVFDYPQIGSCLQPHVNFVDNCGGYWNRTFTPSATLWQRFWLYIGSDFIGSEPYTKITKIGANGFSDWLTFTWGNSTGLVMDNQGWPTAGETRLLFTSANVVRGTWTCIEVGRTVNTPGVANGTFILYQDNVLRANYTDVGWRLTGDNSLPDYARLYRQYGSGTLRIDQYAVGNTRIGCDGSTPLPGPLPDTSPPSAPTNLNVTELWERVKTLVATVWSWLGPASAEAATAASDQAVIRWEPRPGQRFTIDLTGFAWSGAKTFADLDAGIGLLTVPLPGLPPGQPGDDRWLCAQERDGKALTGCNQLALGPIVLPPPPIPVPQLEPQPQPVPDLIGPAIVTMSGDKVFIACDPARYTKANTTGRGTKRVITCLP